MNKKFYKYAGLWWTSEGFDENHYADNISNPFCNNCYGEFYYPSDAFLLNEDEDEDEEPIVRNDWKGIVTCEVCGKTYELKETLQNLKLSISALLRSNYRSRLEKISLEEPLTQVKVRDQDDQFFIAAKIGQKDGKRVGVVYFGEKTKDQKKEDYSQIFIDLEDEQLRFDKSNKHPKDILAKFSAEFPSTKVTTKIKKP